MALVLLRQERRSPKERAAELINRFDYADNFRKQYERRAIENYKVYVGYRPPLPEEAQGRSNLHIPLAYEMVDTLRSRIHQAFVRTRPYVDFVPVPSAQQLSWWTNPAYVEFAEQQAKLAAEQAVAEQVAETRRLEEEQARLEELLDQARARAEQIERRRAAEQARRRAAAAGRTATVTRTHTVGRSAAVKGVGQKYANARWVKEALAGDTQAARGDIAAAWALTQLGKPYVWAAAGPHAYDCSGLTMRAWERAGVRLDHWTGTQWTSGPHVSMDELRRGDLVFFGKVKNDPRSIHHVGIYIGEGLMVHAPRTGDVVRVASIWRRDLFGATRPAG